MDHDRAVVEVDRRARGAIWHWKTYLDRDPPHIAPMDGNEYIVKRGVNVKRAGS